MKYLDGFSGYGGFHLGFEQAGWLFDKCYYSEIDQHAIACYSHNFPNSIYAGSIDTICQNGIITELDLFTFGWPCQDNSIAGKRKGQKSGTRSGLLYSAVNIIDKFKPRNFVAENVAGLLSVNKGIDFIESLKILTFLNESCPQYDIEMQLLNSRWFLPQIRERLFFVGHLRNSGSRQIFPFSDLPESNTQNNSKCTNRCIAGTLNTKNNSGQMPSDKGTVLVVNDRGILRESECLTIDANYYKGMDNHGPLPMVKIFENKVRRLTPLECERMQGLPDNWTQDGNYDGINKKISDTQRYKLTGNGVSIPPIVQIAKRLKY